MKRIFILYLLLTMKFSLTIAQIPLSERLGEEVKKLQRAYIDSKIEQIKKEEEIDNLQKKVIELNDSLKSGCTTYNCVIDKVNDYLNRKNFQAAFDYLNLAESYSDKNSLEITNLRDRFFKLMNSEVKGNKFKNYSCNNYDCVIGKIKKALKIKDYKMVFENLESAESYPAKQDNQIKELRKKLFDAVEKEKVNALVSRREAFTTAFELSKTKNELIETQKETEKALTDLRNASDQAVLLLINEIDRNILRLEYDSTYEKCQIALNLKSEKYGLLVKERIIEIAYWYTETYTAQAAIKTLNLIKLTGLTAKALNVIQNLQAEIRNLCSPQYLTFLEERYYPKMINVEGGTFTVGYFSPLIYQNTPHTVEVSSFKIAETEITVWQYFIFQRVTKHIKPSTPSWQWKGDNPIVNINWYDATFYLNWLNDRSGLQKVYELSNKTGNEPYISYDVLVDYDKKGYRLPTEAEWEFAAQGGVKTKGYKFSGSNDIEEVAWYDANSKSQTHSVRTKKANELGLFDMSGNVWEWCNDWYVEYDLKMGKNPRGAKEGSSRIILGGSLVNSIFDCRVSSRFSLNPLIRSDTYGFRCVRYD